MRKPAKRQPKPEAGEVRSGNSKPALTPAIKKFVVHWGEMGTRWGVNRTVAQIHALLYVLPEPLHAEEIMDALIVARSNVSTSLRELQGWGLVKVVHVLGERRDYFEAVKDPWEMFRMILAERKRREIDPTLEALAECVEQAPADTDAEREARARLTELQAYLQTVDGWYREIADMPTSKIKRLMRFGAKLRRLL